MKPWIDVCRTTGKTTSMKRLPFLVALLVTLGCGDSRPRSQDSASSIIEEALRLEAAKEGEKAAQLEEMAFVRMRRSPSDVPAVWQLLKSKMERLGSPADHASRLDVFMSEVRGALSECQTISEFSTVWNVLKEIEVAAQKTHASLHVLALQELTQATQGIAGPSTSFEDDVTALISMRSSAPSNTNDQALAFVLSSSLADWDEEDAPADKTQAPDATLERFRGAVAGLVTSVLGKGDAFLRSELDRLAQEAAKDKRGEAIDPAPGMGGGTYHRAIAAFEQLQIDVEAADLACWSLIAHADFSEQIETIGTRLAELSWQATGLQALRYNIWALRQIRLAETALSWPDILGSIDLQNLDPSVSSLYSLTYDDLIRKESDPLRRDVCVRTLLSQEKIRQEQF